MSEHDCQERRPNGSDAWIKGCFQEARAETTRSAPPRKSLPQMRLLSQARPPKSCEKLSLSRRTCTTVTSLRTTFFSPFSGYIHRIDPQGNKPYRGYVEDCHSADSWVTIGLTAKMRNKGSTPCRSMPLTSLPWPRKAKLIPVIGRGQRKFGVSFVFSAGGEWLYARSHFYSLLTTHFNCKNKEQPCFNCANPVWGRQRSLKDSLNASSSATSQLLFSVASL